MGRLSEYDDIEREALYPDVNLTPSPPFPSLPSWTFHIGIHRGSLTSRDAESPKPLESLEACQEEAIAALRFYSSLGCSIWFCYAKGPDNQKVLLLPSQPYS